VKAKVLIVAMALSMAAFVSHATAGGKPQRPKHHHGRVVAHSHNNLPPEFGSASGSSGEGTTDDAPPPDEPADDGDTGQPPNIGTQGDSSPGQDNSNPQVVTSPTSESGGVTAAPLPPPPYDACRNLADVQPSVPLGFDRTDEGDCFKHRSEDNYGLCEHDQFINTPQSQIVEGLKAGQQLGPWVEGYGLVCWLSDVVTYGGNPAELFFTGYYVGDGGMKDGLFKCSSPYEDWHYYPYWAKKSQVLGQVFPSPNCG